MSDEIHEYVAQINLLQNEDPTTRMQAMSRLFRSGNSKAIYPIGERLLNDNEPEVRARAATVLGRIGEATAAEFLTQALKDDSVEVRRRTVQALNQLDGFASPGPLIKVLKDSDRDVRRWAARTLGQLGDAQSLKHLKKLLNDPNPVVQDEVAVAIRCIQDRQRLNDQRKKVQDLREIRNQMEAQDLQLDGQIDLEQLNIYQLEARLAAQQVTPPTNEQASEEEQQKQNLIYELSQLIRELERLSQSVRAPYLRSIWENQLVEVNAMMSAWESLEDEPSGEIMKADLQKLRQNKEKRSDTERIEVIEMIDFVSKGNSWKLQIQRINDTVTDPNNQLLLNTWLSEVDAEYRLLQNARDQGNHETAKEHFDKLKKIVDEVKQVKDKEDQDKVKASKLVIRFILVSLATLIIVLWVLAITKLAEMTIPALGIPYAVVAWSALGSIAAMLYQFINRPVSQLETTKWLVARPIQGIIMGSFLYLTLSAGLLFLGNPDIIANQQQMSETEPLRQSAAVVVAFLGGFSDRLSEAMVKRATSIMTQDQEHNSSD